MSSAFQQVVKSKDAARQRLRQLPWLEKLEMLGALRERLLLLKKMRPRVATERQRK